MTDKTKIQVTVTEDAELIARIDDIAEREGLKRADILRRAIRTWLFSLPNTHDNVSITAPKELEPTAA